MSGNCELVFDHTQANARQLGRRLHEPRRADVRSGSWICRQQYAVQPAASRHAAGHRPLHAVADRAQIE